MILIYCTHNPGIVTVARGACGGRPPSTRVDEASSHHASAPRDTAIVLRVNHEQGHAAGFQWNFARELGHGLLWTRVGAAKKL